MASITLTTIANGETTNATIAMANWNAIKNVVEALVIADITNITASAAELNIMDGVTASTAEINIIDGVTATTAEINKVAGVTAGTVTASKALVVGASKELSTLGTVDITTLQIGGTSVTSTAAELNKLAGASANVTAANLGVLTGGTETTLHSHAGSTTTLVSLGVTASAAELNIMDGVIASTAELNYVDGVTSAIQTQLAAKMSGTGSMKAISWT